MLDTIRALFTGQRPPPPPSDLPAAAADVQESGADPLHVAACALLLDIAWADGEFSATERAHLEDVFARHFGLAAEERDRIMALADERRRSLRVHVRAAPRL
jgi:uncharacterized tellurite resistance protein B-like protein